VAHPRLASDHGDALPAADVPEAQLAVLPHGAAGEPGELVSEHIQQADLVVGGQRLFHRGDQLLLVVLFGDVALGHDADQVVRQRRDHLDHLASWSVGGGAGRLVGGFGL
jgi:hypothetical protein